MSLKQKLNGWLKAEGKMIPIDVIERQVREWGYKISNYERRLRKSESPNVERVTKNGAIIGYYWKESPSVANLTSSTPLNAHSPFVQKFLQRNENEWHKPVKPIN